MDKSKYSLPVELIVRIGHFSTLNTKIGVNTYWAVIYKACLDLSLSAIDDFDLIKQAQQACIPNIVAN